MPLLKRKPYELSSPPDDLNPKDLVFQVRITKEIFRDYQEYVNRINLYRQRVWTCKYTGKINLTYEEALLSEVKATEKVQQFPKEFMGPVLRLVQFSMVRLDELVSAILKNFKDRFVVDEEVLCVKESVTKPCRIVAVYENPDDGIHSYLVVWLDNDKNPIGSSLEEAKNLVRRKVPPFTRGLLKSFIRESVKNNASRNSLTPLVVLESLCHKHGITTNPPEELKKFFNKQEVNKKESNGVNKRSLVEVMEAEINLNKKPKMMDTELCNGENAHQKGKIMIQDTKTKTETTQVNKSKDNIAQQGKSKSKKSHEDKKANTKTFGEDESQAKTQPDKKDKTVRGDKSKAKIPQVDNKKEKMVQRDKRKAETLQEDNKKEKVVQGDKIKVETPQDDKNKAKTTILKDGNEANNEPVAKVVPIKYPIEDSLVQPSPDDPLLPNKPVPLSDFPLPMDCTGRLLMVWNFCTLFGKVIRLSPFPLDELAKALDCKDKDNILLKEAHHALIKLILSDPAIHEEFQEIRNPKTKVTIDTWEDEYCDLSKLEGFKSLVEHSMTINDGNYMLLEPSIKLDILCGLVDCALNSTGIREQLDIYIEEKQAIASQKRKEEMESSKMEKEAQEKLKQQGQNTGVSVTQLPVHEYDPRVAENVKNECSEESISEDGMDNEESNLEKNSMHFGGLSNGSQDNGNAEETLVASARSRQRLLKIRAELKQAEESMKERKRNEEQRKLQELQRAKRVAVKERKLQERKIIELHKRQEHLDREIEKRVIRTNPLGRDKDYNRYWFFPRDGRIFVEDEKSTTWGYYAAKEELEVLLHSLNTKGIRERALQRQLEKHYGKISESFQKRSKEIAQQRVTLDDTSIRRSSRGKTISQQTEYTYKNKYRN